MAFFLLYNQMIIVDPTNTVHTSKVIPRIDINDLVVYELYNETTRQTAVVPNLSIMTDGYLQLDYSYEFVEGQKFAVTITQNNEVVYRGRLFATAQRAQDYDPTEGIYTYSTI